MLGKVLESNNDNTLQRRYVALLSMNYQRLYSYILLLVANHNNADDIMQETSILMYEKFDSFREGTDFLDWAKTIAKYKTFEFLKKQRREKVVLNQQIIELIDNENSLYNKKQDDWLNSLRKCVSLLPEEDRRFLHTRYHGNESVKEMAHRIGCSFQKIYRNMARINNILLKCVRKQMETG